MSNPKNPNKNKKSNKPHNINLTIINDPSKNPVKNLLKKIKIDIIRKKLQKIRKLI